VQVNLIHHPATPPSEPLKVWANVEHSASLGSVASTNIWFGIGAPISRFVIPPPGEPKRAEDLWESTCCEAFLRVPGAAAYREWNFAPSGEWAAYDFTSYRDGKSEADVAPPYIRLEDNLTWWGLGATFAVAADAMWALGVSAILEEQDGTRSYWALSHPPGDKADFHDPACFAALLP
jgi:hypothetical protein